MSEERFAEFVQREAAAYHTPPADVPRDEMWQAVAAARAARRPVGDDVRSLAPRGPHRLRHAAWLGMAATLLLGIGIGRYATRAGNPADAPTRTAEAGTGLVVGGPMTQTPATQAPAAGSAREDRRSVQSASHDLPRTVTPRREVAAVPARSGNGDAEVVSTVYQVASRQHLERAEALLAVVAAAPHDAVMDSLTARWARDVLTNTRLLLDSPAGEDPVRRRLLEDLETLLVQMIQRSGGALDERDLIDRTLERTQLLTRLRSGATGT